MSVAVSASFDPGAPALGGGIYGLPHTPDDARVVLVPVPWEPTTSYRRGTARGPAAILQASRQVDLFDHETGRPYEAGIAMLAPDPEIAAWNAAVYVAQIEDQRLAEVISDRRYLDATCAVLQRHGGLWFFDESYVISRKRD